MRPRNFVILVQYALTGLADAQSRMVRTGRGDVNVEHFIIAVVSKSRGAMYFCCYYRAINIQPTSSHEALCFHGWALFFNMYFSALFLRSCERSNKKKWPSPPVCWLGSSEIQRRTIKMLLTQLLLKCPCVGFVTRSIRLAGLSLSLWHY